MIGWPDAPPRAENGRFPGTRPAPCWLYLHVTRRSDVVDAVTLVARRHASRR
jgi:hypothetical protein